MKLLITLLFFVLSFTGISQVLQPSNSLYYRDDINSKIYYTSTSLEITSGHWFPDKRFIVDGDIQLERIKTAISTGDTAIAIYNNLGQIYSFEYYEPTDSTFILFVIKQYQDTLPDSKFNIGETFKSTIFRKFPSSL